MSGLDALVVARLAKLIPMLATSHDGGALATARAIVRVLESAGADLHDVVAALSKPPVERVVYRETREPDQQFVDDWQEIHDAASRLLEQYSLRRSETDFVTNMRDLADRYQDGFRMTEKQAKWFRRMVDEHLGMGIKA